MSESLVHSILRELEHIEELYHRLVILAAPSGSGKTEALQVVHERAGGALINVNLELSRAMLDLTARQRSLRLPSLLSDLIEKCGTRIVLLDNIEILFCTALGQDPLRVLQTLSRSRTVVATWNGSVVDNHLVYAAPDHPEYRKYPIKDLCIVTPEATEETPEQSFSEDNE